MLSQPGTYKITGGTGKYADITGHGTYQLSFTFIASRTRGKCSTAVPPAGPAGTVPPVRLGPAVAVR